MDAFMGKYFINFEEKSAIEVLTNYPTEIDRLIVLGNLVRVKRQPIADRASYYYPGYYQQYTGGYQRTKYPEKWLAEITKLKEISVPDRILPTFRTGLEHYLDNVENEAKLLAFSLGP